MAQDVLKQNERYLCFSGQVAQFLGLLLLFAIFTVALLSLLGVIWDNLPTKYLTKAVGAKSIWEMAHVVFLALFLLGISQFIHCLTEADFKPKWILRNSDKLIYLYVCLIFISYIYSFVNTKNMLDHYGHDMSYCMVLIPMGIFAIVRMVLWIAFAFILKRLLPIIQASKTRV